MMRTNILVLLTLLGSLTAQTLVSGNVSGVWDENGSPYQFTDNCVVTFGDSLVIMPQTRVDMDSTFELRVQGFLSANRVIFHGGSNLRGDSGELELSGCTFIGLEDGVKLIGGSAKLDHCLIDGASGTGLSFSNVDTSHIRDSQILRSGDYGIKIFQSDEVEVSGNILSGNSINDFSHPALFIDSCSPEVIENNIIKNNHAQGIGVWTLTSVAHPTISRNLIQGNYTGITLVNSPAYILDNIIIANYQEGNFNSGAGIFAGYGSSVGIVMGNYIAGNYYGVSIINGAAPNLGDMVNDYPGDDGLNLFFDNTYGGDTWHIWNGTNNIIHAQNNYWLGMDLSEVDGVIHDNEEGAGEVLYEPIYTTPLPEPPDINNDEGVNILDVVVLIENIINPGIPEPVVFYLSDINQDYELDVSDVTVLIEMVIQP